MVLIGAGLAIGVQQMDAQAAAARWAGWIGLGIVAVGLLWGVVHWVELRTSEFAVTTTRVIFKVGLVARYSTELLLAKGGIHLGPADPVRPSPRLW